MQDLSNLRKFWVVYFMTKKKNHAYFLLCNLSSNHHFAFLHANLTEWPGAGGKNYVSFQLYVSSKQNFADLTGLPHIRVNTEKHSFQQHLCNNHKNMTWQFVCLFAYAVCDSVSKTFSDWKWPYLHFWAPWAPPPLAQNCCLSGSHQSVWLGSTS